MNLEFHNQRMMKSLHDLFNLDRVINLENFISVPGFASAGTYKCRVVYDREIRLVEFLSYRLRPVNSLKIVENNEISYDYKFTDRKVIEELLSVKGDCDDILIVRNGKVTDTSYANVVFRDSDGKWVTPVTFLLPGTMRASLLAAGIISEREITIDRISDYSEIRLINAMIGIDDTEGIPVSRIEF